MEDCCSWCERHVVAFEVTLRRATFEATRGFRPSWRHRCFCFVVFVVVVSTGPMRLYSNDSAVPPVGAGLAFGVVLRPSLVLFSVSPWIRSLFLFSWSASAEVVCGLPGCAPSLSSIPFLALHPPDQRNTNSFSRNPSTLRIRLFRPREHHYWFLSLAFAWMDLFVSAFGVSVVPPNHFGTDCDAVVVPVASFAGPAAEAVGSFVPEIA